MGDTAADYLCERLIEWGVDTIYGFPGGINGILGDPNFTASQNIPYVPYHAFARLIGLKGIRVDRADQIEVAWQEAFAADRPVVIDALTDPEEPPIPPHVTFAQMEAMTKAFAGAPKEGLPGAVEAVREFAEEFIPGR